MRISIPALRGLSALLMVVALMDVRAEITSEQPSAAYDEPEVWAYIPYNQDPVKRQQSEVLNPKALEVYIDKSSFLIRPFRLDRHNSKDLKTVN